MSLLEQYLIRGRSNSETLENIGKRVKEDVSFEESAKVERKLEVS